MADYQKVVDAINVVATELSGEAGTRAESLARTKLEECQFWLSLVPEVQNVTGFGYAKQEHDKRVSELETEVEDLRKQLANAQPAPSPAPSPAPVQ